MKRCPTCNQTFTDEWLTFCTTDGTPLMESEEYQPPAIAPEPSAPAEVIPTPPPTPTAPDIYSPPSIPSQWQPPPQRSGLVVRPSQGLAVASMVLGLVSITLGWCCSFGLISSPAAIVLGIYALSQIKSQPDRYTGRPLAIVGIVTGGLYFVILAILILLYGLGILLSGLR